ncbi:hypothetical protein Hanom_Chr17g01548351 [Helianthus anomalus]
MLTSPEMMMKMDVTKTKMRWRRKVIDDDETENERDDGCLTVMG